MHVNMSWCNCCSSQRSGDAMDKPDKTAALMCSITWIRGQSEVYFLRAQHAHLEGMDVKYYDAAGTSTGEGNVGKDAS